MFCDKMVQAPVVLVPVHRWQGTLAEAWKPSLTTTVKSIIIQLYETYSLLLTTPSLLL